jgi:hypothetical protein
LPYLPAKEDEVKSNLPAMEDATLGLMLQVSNTVNKVIIIESKRSLQAQISAAATGSGFRFTKIPSALKSWFAIGDFSKGLFQPQPSAKASQDVLAKEDVPNVQYISSHRCIVPQLRRKAWPLCSSTNLGSD